MGFFEIYNDNLRRESKSYKMDDSKDKEIERLQNELKLKKLEQEVMTTEGKERSFIDDEKTGDYYLHYSCLVCNKPFTGRKVKHICKKCLEEEKKK